jgi:hypothetical protein
MTQYDIIRMACGYTAVDPRWYELLEPADFIAEKETHDVAVIVSVHKQRPIAPDYYRLNFADGSYMDATDNDVSANYRPYVLISRIAVAQVVMEDAAMIAAAFEMYQALETIVSTERDRHGYHPAWTDQARAAIAKARGEK